MTESLPIVLVILWTAWVLQGVLSAVQVRKAGRLYDRIPRPSFDDYHPPAAVIVPFKGIDQAFSRGVHALFNQEYPLYELILVVESDSDPAYPLLIKALAQYPNQKAQVFVAGVAKPNEGQKVHNQLHAIDHLISRDPAAQDEPKVWVFADSDAIPGPSWLRHLVKPLKQKDITGVTTGYRWLVPVSHKNPQPTVSASNHLDDNHHTHNPTIWSQLASVMNSSIACMLGHDRFNHAWGGSMALRAETAQRGKLRDRLTGALCDDYQFSRLSRDLRLRVYYVPQCLIATPVDFDFAQLANFAHRQYLLTRIYAPKLFATALLLTSLYTLGYGTALAWLIGQLYLHPYNTAWLWPACVIGISLLTDQLRATYRHRLILKVFDRKTVSQLQNTLILDRYATPIWMILHGLLILRASFGRIIRWRGITYRLYDPQQVKRIQTS